MSECPYCGGDEDKCDFSFETEQCSEMKKFALNSFCPFCFGPTANANNLWRDDAPKPGDYAMCKFCGEMSVFFDHGKRLRKPTVTERKLISKHPGAQTLRQNWRRE